MPLDSCDQPTLDVLEEGIAWLGENVGIRISPVAGSPGAQAFVWDSDVEARIQDILEGDPSFCRYAPARSLEALLRGSDGDASDVDRDLYEMEAAALIELAFSKTNLAQLSIENATRPEGYSFSKINHGYWEQIALMSSVRLERDYFRPLVAKSWHGGFHDLLLHLLTNSPAWKGAPAGLYAHEDSSVAIGFGNGDWLSNRENVDAFFSPAIRGALIGYNTYVRRVIGVSNLSFVDASFPKRLIWDGRFQDFLDLATFSSDMVLFIVPSYLSGIRIKSCNAPQTSISIPPRRIYDHYRVVLPYLIGRIIRHLRTAGSITIFCQAAAMSAAFGIIVDVLRSRMPEKRIRYYDLGQALDIAMSPNTQFSTWLRLSRVSDQLSWNPFYMVA